jgi:hypothetical protein
MKQLLVHGWSSGSKLSLFHLCALMFFSAGLIAQTTIEPRERDAGSTRIMSVEVTLYLLDSKECQSSVLPAYRAFSEHHDTDLLVRLIQKVLPEIRSGKRHSYWLPEFYEEAIAILTGKQYYSSEETQPTESNAVTSKQDYRVFVDNSVAPSLIELLCVPQGLGVNPKQSMSGTELMNYLYSQSPWIEDYFTGSKQPSGPLAEIKIGESSRFFTREEVLAFDAELRRIKRPEDEHAAVNEFDDLSALVHAATTDPNLMILFSVS